MIVLLLLTVLFATFQVTVTDYLVNNPDFYQLDAYTWESDEFRSMKLGELLVSQTAEKALDYDMLTALMIEHEYDLTELEELTFHKGPLQERRGADYRKLKSAYETVFADLKYFPVPESTSPATPAVTFEDGWLDKRTFGGERVHEGCDIMGVERERGFYPVLSMSDGVVEKAGWLEMGGWRLGIRTPSGLYVYYAHLYGYSRDWKAGDTVKAGELLGFMGDSGYSALEGTTGNFDVHLHVGLYLKTDHYDELSVNPYWILKYLENDTLKVNYQELPGGTLFSAE